MWLERGAAININIKVCAHKFNECGTRNVFPYKQSLGATGSDSKGPHGIWQ
jgi:hypothetical protein